MPVYKQLLVIYVNSEQTCEQRAEPSKSGRRSSVHRPVAEVKPEVRPPPESPTEDGGAWETLSSETSDGVEIIISRGFNQQQLETIVRIENQIRAEQDALQGGPPLPTEWTYNDGEMEVGTEAANLGHDHWEDEGDEETEVIIHEVEAMDLEDASPE